MALCAAMLLFLAGWHARGEAGEAYAVMWEPLPSASPQSSQSYLPEQAVDLNTATLSDLLTLPGIGENRARAILDYRDAHGPFTWPEELLDVPGVGQSLFERVAPYVAIASPAPSSSP